MKFQLRSVACKLALLLLCATGLYAGSRPITISDGSVCLADQRQQGVPNTEGYGYEDQFTPSKVFLEMIEASGPIQDSEPSQDMKDCRPIETKIANCEELDNVKSIVVQFKDANTIRNVALNFEGGMVRVHTVDLKLQDWRPHGPPTDRTKVKRDGPQTRQHKIQWIFVDGVPRDCRGAFCRVTIQNADSPTQAR